MITPAVSVIDDPANPGGKVLVGFSRFDEVAGLFPVWQRARTDAARNGLSEQDRLRLTCVRLLDALLETEQARHTAVVDLRAEFRARRIEPGH